MPTEQMWVWCSSQDLLWSAGVDQHHLKVNLGNTLLMINWFQHHHDSINFSMNSIQLSELLCSLWSSWTGTTDKDRLKTKIIFLLSWADHVVVCDAGTEDNVVADKLHPSQWPVSSSLVSHNHGDHHTHPDPWPTTWPWFNCFYELLECWGRSQWSTLKS